MSPVQRALKGYLHQVICHLLVQVSSGALDPVVLFHAAFGGVVTQVDVDCSQTLGRSWARHDLYTFLLGTPRQTDHKDVTGGEQAGATWAQGSLQDACKQCEHTPWRFVMQGCVHDWAAAGAFQAACSGCGRNTSRRRLCGILAASLRRALSSRVWLHCS